MKSLLRYIFVVTTTLSSAIGFSQNNLYVSTTGDNTTNNCQLPGNPCATIAHAYTQSISGDTIKIAPGTYNLPTTLTITKAIGITALDANDKPVITSNSNDVIVVNSSDVTISNLKFNMGLTTTSGMKGIVSTQNFDNLKLLNNEFASLNPISGTPGTNMVWNAFAISLVTAPSNVFNVEISGNSITAAPAYNIFGRGIFLGNGGASLHAPGGLISNNDVSAYYTVQGVLFADDMEISNNNMNGILMVNAPLASVQVDVLNNTFSGQTQMTPDHLYALVEIRSIDNASVNIANNNFVDYTRIGFISQASKNVTLANNTFTPLASANAFISAMVNTKIMTNGVQGNTYADEIEIVGNTFNAATANTGSALVFADHFGVNTPAFGNVKIGSAIATEKNIFDVDLGNHIVLDNESGASSNYALWNGYAVTTMKPVSEDFTALAIHNNYGLTDFTQIEAKNIDNVDNANLGKVIIKSTGNVRYVATTGSDISNDCTDSSQPCATIGHAISVAEVANTIEIAQGTYPQTALLQIDLDSLIIKAENLANKPVITTDQATLFNINAKEVSIEGLRMEMGLTATTGKYAIESTTSNFNNLNIEENEIVSTNTSTIPSMIWDSYAIRLYSTVGNLDTVSILNNYIGSAGATNALFGRAIALGSGSTDGASATIQDNEVAGFYTIQIIRSTGDVEVSNNIFTGITMVNYPYTGVNITLNDNEFDGISSSVSSNLYALVDIRSIETGSVELSNNAFKNYMNIGLLSMASKNVSVIENTFTPEATAEEFASVMVNTKLMTNGVQNNTNPNEIELIGNDFKAGALNKGNAIVFADHYGTTTPAFSNVVIGGASTSLKNIFSPSIANYIVMDDKTGASNTFPLWAGYAVTTMKPVTENIEALYVNNTYNYATIAEVELKNIDSLDNGILGKVILAHSFVGTDEAKMASVKLYPNPATENLTIELNKEFSTAKMTIIDILGNVLVEKNISGKQEVNISHLAAGTYIIRLSNNKDNTAMRFVKK